MEVLTLPTPGRNYADIHALAVSPDGRELRATTGGDEGANRLVFWDLAGGKAIRRENIVTDEEHGLSWPLPLFAPDDSAMTVGNTVKRVGKKRRITLVPPPRAAGRPSYYYDDYCEPRAVTPDGRHLVGGANSISSGERWPLYVWSLADAFAAGVEELPAGRELRMPEGAHTHDAAVTAGGTLGVLSEGVKLYRYRFDTFEPLAAALVTLPGGKRGFGAGRLLAVTGGGGLAAANDRGVHLIDDGDAAPRLTVPTGPVREVAFTPSGDRFVAASEGGEASVWDARTGERLAAYDLRKLAGRALGAVAVSPDGLTAFAGGTRGRVVRFDL